VHISLGAHCVGNASSVGLDSIGRGIILEFQNSLVCCKQPGDPPLAAIVSFKGCLHFLPYHITYVPIFEIPLAKKESALEISVASKETVVSMIPYCHIKCHPRIWNGVVVGHMI
nr:hypothetical protein [Tanacetum cinerariifolium]